MCAYVPAFHKQERNVFCNMNKWADCFEKKNYPCPHLLTRYKVSLNEIWGQVFFPSCAAIFRFHVVFPLNMTVPNSVNRHLWFSDSCHSSRVFGDSVSLTSQTGLDEKYQICDLWWGNAQINFLRSKLFYMVFLEIFIYLAFEIYSAYKKLFHFHWFPFWQN